MNKPAIYIGVALLAVLASGWCGAAENGDPAAARIVTADLARFWVAWDAAAGKDTAGREQAFTELYYEPGSPGLRDFFEARIGTVADLVATIDRMPAYYASLRRHTPKARAAAEPVRQAFLNLEQLYPAAVFPDVYIVIGRSSSAGTTGPSGLLIGAEMYGGYPDAPTGELSPWLKSVIRPMEELPHIIAHELIHYQQPNLPDSASLLAQVFREGSADFVAELISGRHINHHVHAWALPREREIWQRFAPLMDGTERHGFLYGGDETPEGWPADVGYFIGYRIAQAYYAQAADKRQALADIITASDVKNLLARSGYADQFNTKE